MIGVIPGDGAWRGEPSGRVAIHKEKPVSAACESPSRMTAEQCHVILPFLPSEFEQVPRNAKHLAHQKSIPLHESQDRIAQSRHFKKVIVGKRRLCARKTGEPGQVRSAGHTPLLPAP